MTKNRLSLGLKKAQSRLLNQNSRKILNNVFLLYIVLFASITDLLYLVSTGAHSNVIVFIVSAYVTSMFSKNMTVVLIVALAITNIYHLGRGIIVKEGFEEGTEDEEGEEGEEGEDSTDEEETVPNSDESSDTTDPDSLTQDKDTESKEPKTKKKNKKNENETLPKEYKDTLAQLSDPETLKTIEGLKSLKPLLGKMERVIGMFN
jgi:hypothetical protein